MKRNYCFGTTAVSLAAMLVLILDSKTALSGAADGITLCLRSVIPSLFPLILVGLYLNSRLSGSVEKMLRPLGRFCGMPLGSESLLITAFLGGYPVGAQSVSQMYAAGQLSKEDARRLLGFCNNAGPAFLFGILRSCFSDTRTLWYLWTIHILSALITGALLPGRSNERISVSQTPPLTLPQSMHAAIKVTGSICGWVVIFKVLISVLTRWALWALPANWRVLIGGLLELTNGCTALCGITNEGLRFIICSVLLAAGGLCVSMQTHSVTGALHGGLYFPGKAIQTCLCFIIANAAQYLLFSEGDTFNAGIIFPAISLSVIPFTLLAVSKKTVAFPKIMMYDKDNHKKMRFEPCCSGKKFKNPVSIAPTQHS